MRMPIFLCLWLLLLSSLSCVSGSAQILVGQPSQRTRVLASTSIRSLSKRQRRSSTTHQHVDSDALISIPRRLLAGGMSRAVAQMTLYPIDALRTLAQTRDGRTLADVGVASLIRGSTTTSAFALFMGAIQFSIFGICKQRYHMPPILASALGAAGSCVVSVPQEVIKQRLVTGIYASFRSAVVSIARDEGLAGFYSAWKPTVARNVPFVITTFTSMDMMKRWRLQQQQQRASKDGTQPSGLSTVETIVIGMTAALIAGIVTNPIDVVKTRMMTQAASNQIPYASALDCFTTILKTEGITKFYAGFQQRSIYMCSLWGITFGLNGRFEKKT